MAMRRAQLSGHWNFENTGGAASSSDRRLPGHVPHPRAGHGSSNFVVSAPASTLSAGVTRSAEGISHQLEGHHASSVPAQQILAAHASRARPHAAHSLSYVKAVVKNTFIDVVDDVQDTPRGLVKSASDSDLSGSSEEQLHFWLPSLTSSSKASSSSDVGAITENPVSAAPKCHSLPSCAGADTSGHVGAPWPRELSEPPLPEIPLELPQTIGGGEITSPGTELLAAQGLHGAASTMDAEMPTIVKQIHEETGIPIAELLEAHKKQDLSAVPRHLTTGVLLSVGSISHWAGGCTPCMFHPSKLCTKGVTCNFCHVRHRNAKFRRFRAPKKTRQKMMAAASETNPVVDADCSSDDEQDVEIENSSQTAPSGSYQDVSHLEAEQPSGRDMNGQFCSKVRL